MQTENRWQSLYTSDKFPSALMETQKVNLTEVGDKSYHNFPISTMPQVFALDYTPALKQVFPIMPQGPIVMQPALRKNR